MLADGLLRNVDLIEHVVVSVGNLRDRLSKRFLRDQSIELLDDGARVLCEAHSEVRLRLLQLVSTTLVVSIRGLQGSMQRLQDFLFLLGLREENGFLCGSHHLVGQDHFLVPRLSVH